MMPEAADSFPLSIHAPQNPVSGLFHRKAIVEDYIPSFNGRLVAVSSQWFREYITFSKGAVHDYYVFIV